MKMVKQIFNLGKIHAVGEPSRVSMGWVSGQRCPAYRHPYRDRDIFSQQFRNSAI